MSDWLNDVPESLLALDAPLGWPKALGRELVRHRAGEAVPAPAESLFKRATDRHVKERYGHTPLEVGASFIARTALAALGMLDEVRRATGRGVPLAWSPADALPAAIEVYPAATVRAHHPRAAALDRDARGAFLQSWIGETFRLDRTAEAELRNEHVRDAAVCGVAGLDFLAGRALAPQHEETAREEGWIWVRRPS